MEVGPAILQNAREQLTLATIAKSGEGHSIEQIRSAMLVELAKTQYATEGYWDLVWGPAKGGYGDNLLFVVKHRVNGSYSIVMRATMKTLSSWWEDIPTHQVICPYIDDVEARVSAHFLDGFKGMLDAPDETGFRLSSFLETVIRQKEVNHIYVAGHSQGASLAVLAAAWLNQRLREWDPSGSVKTSCYASATPSPGDPAFAEWIGANTSCIQYVNPLDAIPYWYGVIDQIIPDNVPIELPSSIEGQSIRLAIETWAKHAKKAGSWGQSLSTFRLRTVQMPSTIGYYDQVDGQHIENSYLYLLGAPPVDTAGPSPLPRFDPTRRLVD